MAMHLAKLAGTAIVLSLVVHPGYAVELIPIELTAISQAVEVSLLGTPGVQSSSGTSDVVVQWTDFDGSGSASASEIDGQLIFRLKVLLRQRPALGVAREPREATKLSSTSPI